MNGLGTRCSVLWTRVIAVLGALFLFAGLTLAMGAQVTAGDEAVTDQTPVAVDAPGSTPATVDAPAETPVTVGVPDQVSTTVETPAAPDVGAPAVSTEPAASSDAAPTSAADNPGGPPGVHGDLKTHEAGDDPLGEFDRPKVCNLELVGHDFDAGLTLPLRISEQASGGFTPVWGPTVVTTDSGGHFVYPSPAGTGFGALDTTAPYVFPYAGMFKVEWDPENDGRYEKWKVVKLECAAPPPAGDVTITKYVVGSANIGSGEGWPFSVHVTIPAMGLDESYVLTEVAPSVTIHNVPEGATVTAVETGTGGADHVAYAPASGEITYEEGVAEDIFVTNTFDPTPVLGDVTITKYVAGVANIGPGEGWPFTVHVTIPAMSLDESYVLTEVAPSVTIHNVPPGATVTAVETGTGGADAIAYDPVSGVITYEEGVSEDISITNTYTGDVNPETGGVVVTKLVAGTPGAGEGWPFTVHVTVVSGSVTVLDQDYVLTKAAPSVLIPDVPDGATVTAVETGKGGADSTSYDPVTGVVTHAQGQQELITVTNTFTTIEVAGESAERKPTLPLTGSSPFVATALGVLLVLTGSTLLLSARRRVAPLDDRT